MASKRIIENSFIIQYHYVWCTKFMRPVLEGEVSTRLEELFHEKAHALKGVIYWVKIEPAVVQLKCSFSPRIAPYQIVFGLKDHSAHFLRKEFPWLNSRLSNLWTRRYYVCTEGESTESSIERFLVEEERTNHPRFNTTT